MTIRQYAWAWSALATERFDLNGGLALHNPDLPVLQSNAIFDFGVSDLSAARTWLEARVGFVTVYSSADHLREIQPQKLEPGFYTEQVNWTQARALAQVWCEVHDSSWESFVPRALTRAMQNEASLTAFLAFDLSQPVGMLLAFDNIVLLEAGVQDARLELRDALITMLGSSIWV